MGFVADTASVDGYSKVVGDARVEGNAVLISAVVDVHAVVRDSAKVTNARVVGGALVEGSAQVRNCVIKDNARVYGNAKIYHINVLDNVCVFGDARLVFTSSGLVELQGACKFGGAATFEGLRTFDDFVEKYGSDKVKLESFSKTQDLYGIIVLTDVWDMG